MCLDSGWGPIKFEAKFGPGEDAEPLPEQSDIAVQRLSESGDAADDWSRITMTGAQGLPR